MIRTHDAGKLRASDAGTTVTLAGWVARRRDHGGVIFVDLRDASGVVQVVFREEDAHALRNEFCVKVTGEVSARPEGNENPELATGDGRGGRVRAGRCSPRRPRCRCRSTTPITAADDLRLQVPLPRPAPQRPGQRAAAAQPGQPDRPRGAARPRLPRDRDADPDPVDPRGRPRLPGPGPPAARHLVRAAAVAAAVQAAADGRPAWSATTRSPAATATRTSAPTGSPSSPSSTSRCRSSTQDDIIELGEEIVATLWSELAGYEIPTPIPRITWTDAMNRYGSDKPDLRYGVELVELTDYLRGTEFRVFAGAIDAGGYVGAVVMPGGAAQTRKELDGWQDWAKARGARGLAYVVLDAETGEARGPVAKNLSAEHLAGLADAVGAKPGDAIFFAAANERREAQELLGAARIEIAKRAGLIDESAWAFCWVVDAPMFENDRGAAAGPRCTTPSPRPNAEWMDRLRGGARPGAGLRVRHRLQRQRDRRRQRPYPPGRRAEPGLRPARHHARGGAGQVRLPARGVQVRPAAARRHRHRLGPDLHAARPATTRSARSSRSRRPAAASTR